MPCSDLFCPNGNDMLLRGAKSRPRNRRQGPAWRHNAWVGTGIAVLAMLASTGYAQTPKPASVDWEMMTWPELKAARDAGKTTVLVYNGGIETRGPQNVNGGHTLMAHATAIAIAEKLGNAIAAPVLTFSPNNANANLPGTIGLTNDIFAAVNERVAEQIIANGFKNVVLMGDHGGGQQQLGEVPRSLTRSMARRASTSISAIGFTRKPTTSSTNI